MKREDGDVWGKVAKEGQWVKGTKLGRHKVWKKARSGMRRQEKAKLRQGGEEVRWWWWPCYLSTGREGTDILQCTIRLLRGALKPAQQPAGEPAIQAASHTCSSILQVDDLIKCLAKK